MLEPSVKNVGKILAVLLNPQVYIKVFKESKYSVENDYLTTTLGVVFAQSSVTKKPPKFQSLSVLLMGLNETSPSLKVIDKYTKTILSN